MSDNPGFSWNQLVPNSSDYAAYSSGSSSFSVSPAWTNASLAASSPSPSGGHAMLPLPPVEAIAFDYNMLSQIHLPFLRREFRHNEAAKQTLQMIVSRVAQGFLPEDSLLNQLILQDAGGFRCSVGSCQRHTDPYLRLGRAREHFRAEHLGAYFPCHWPGW